MIRQPQCAHVGARTWIAHSKLSKTWLLPPWTIVNALSYSLPHNTHFAMAGLLENRTFRASFSPCHVRQGNRGKSSAYACVQSRRTENLHRGAGGGNRKPGRQPLG